MQTSTHIWNRWLTPGTSDVNKDWTCKDKDKDQAYKDKDFTYGYLLHVAAKPTIAIKQQQWTRAALTE